MQLSFPLFFSTRHVHQVIKFVIRHDAPSSNGNFCTKEKLEKRRIRCSYVRFAHIARFHTPPQISQLGAVGKVLRGAPRQRETKRSQAKKVNLGCLNDFTMWLIFPPQCQTFTSSGRNAVLSAPPHRTARRFSAKWLLCRVELQLGSPPWRAWRLTQIPGENNLLRLVTVTHSPFGGPRCWATWATRGSEHELFGNVSACGALEARTYRTLRTCVSVRA